MNGNNHAIDYVTNYYSCLHFFPSCKKIVQIDVICAKCTFYCLFGTINILSIIIKYQSSPMSHDREKAAIESSSNVISASYWYMWQWKKKRTNNNDRQTIDWVEKEREKNTFVRMKFGWSSIILSLEGSCFVLGFVCMCLVSQHKNEKKPNSCWFSRLSAPTDTRYHHWPQRHTADTKKKPHTHWFWWWWP